MKKWKLWDKILNILFPPDVTCILCGGELKNKNERKFSVCDSCNKDLEYIGDKEQKICNSNLNIKEFYTVFKYENKTKELVLSFKDGNRPYLRENIAKYLFEIYNKKNILCDFICYVPSSPQKINKRGYDPMKLVAKHLSLLSGKETKHLLARKTQVLDQTQTSNRYANISGCFYCESDYDLKGKKILLIDDVVTTGATASECAKVLLLKGGAEVNLLTFTEAKTFTEYKAERVSRMRG
ncbi:MAG: ComF family protein [Bacillota bacterium]